MTSVRFSSILWTFPVCVPPLCLHSAAGVRVGWVDLHTWSSPELLTPQQSRSPPACKCNKRVWGCVKPPPCLRGRDPAHAERFSAPRLVSESSWRCAEHVTPPPPTLPHALLFLTPTLLSSSMWLLLVTSDFRYNCSTSVGTTSQIVRRNVKRVCSEPSGPWQRLRYEPRSLAQTKDALFTGILSWPDRPPPSRMSSGHFFSPSLPVEGKQCL